MKELVTHFESEFYLERYFKFVKLYNNYPKSIHTETHHILPKSLYPEYKNSKWNLVHLPFRAHHIAHWLLAKAIGGRMWYAYYAMSNKNLSSGKLRKLNSVLYEKSRIEFRIKHSNWHNECVEGIANKDRIGQKTRKTKLKKDGYHKEIANRSAKTMKETIQSNGKSIAQNRSERAAKKTRELGLLNGRNNPLAKVIQVFDENDILKYEFNGDFFARSKELNLPTRALKSSYLNNSKPIYQSKCGATVAKNKGFENYIGWYAKSVGQSRYQNKA